MGDKPKVQDQSGSDTRYDRRIEAHNHNSPIGRTHYGTVLDSKKSRMVETSKETQARSEQKGTTAIEEKYTRTIIRDRNVKTICTHIMSDKSLFIRQYTTIYIMKTPRTDIEAFDYRPNQFGGSSFRHTKYGILVESEFARQLEKELNQANDRIKELEAYMALAKSGMLQLADKMKGRV